MNAPRFSGALALCVSVLALGAVAGLHLRNRALAAEVQRLRRASAQSVAAAVTTSPLQSASDQRAERAPPDGARAAELADLRARVRAREEQAARAYAAQAFDASETSRDPETGLTRLEHLRNVGRATPSAAVQTLFWAVLHGEGQVLTEAISIDETGRGRAREFLSRLDETQRAKWPTPESLMALVLSEGVLKVSAIQILETTLDGPGRARVRLRGVTGDDQTVPLVQGGSGWQVRYTDKQVDWAVARLSTESP